MSGPCGKIKKIRVKFHTRRALPIHSWSCQKSKSAKCPPTAIYRAANKRIPDSDQPLQRDLKPTLMTNRNVGDKIIIILSIHLLTIPIGHEGCYAKKWIFQKLFPTFNILFPDGVFHIKCFWSTIQKLLTTSFNDLSDVITKRNYITFNKIRFCSSTPIDNYNFRKRKGKTGLPHFLADIIYEQNHHCN